MSNTCPTLWEAPQKGLVQCKRGSISQAAFYSVRKLSKNVTVRSAACVTVEKGDSEAFHAAGWPNNQHFPRMCPCRRAQTPHCCSAREHPPTCTPPPVPPPPCVLIKTRAATPPGTRAQAQAQTHLLPLHHKPTHTNTYGVRRTTCPAIGRTRTRRREDPSRCWKVEAAPRGICAPCPPRPIRLLATRR